MAEQAKPQLPSLDDVAKAIAGITLQLHVLFGVLVATVFVAFAPDAWLDALSLVKLRSANRPYFGLGIVFSSALVIAKMLAYLYSANQQERDLIKGRKKLLERLQKLSATEKWILKEYVDKDTRSVAWGMQDGVVFGMVDEGILYRPSVRELDHLGGLAVNIQPDVWDHLKKTPGLLDGAAFPERERR